MRSVAAIRGSTELAGAGPMAELVASRTIKASLGSPASSTRRRISPSAPQAVAASPRFANSARATLRRDLASSGEARRRSRPRTAPSPSSNNDRRQPSPPNRARRRASVRGVLAAMRGSHATAARDETASGALFGQSRSPRLNIADCHSSALPLRRLSDRHHRPTNFAGLLLLKASTPPLKSSDWRMRL